MKAIIPVAGAGTRLRPFTTTVPKPLLPVAGKPILAHLMDNLCDFGVDKFIIIVGYLGDKIRQFVEANYPGMAVFIEQERLLGLGYAVKLGLKECGEGPVIVALGDTIIEADMSDFPLNTNLLGLHRVDNPQRFGIVELDGDRIVAMEEKPAEPKSDMAIAGFYYFKDSAKILDALETIVEKGIKTRGEYQLTDAMKLMLERGESFRAKQILGWFDCGTVATLIETNKHLLEKVDTPESRGTVVFIPPVFVGKDTSIERCIIG
ncbi:MAG TPA: hypothetical protein ENN07_01335, partial [candidate division Zixibacteria bacterium]|nr:hypothetical protein [candidate division Zixibacteria bacterium]